MWGYDEVMYTEYKCAFDLLIHAATLYAGGDPIGAVANGRIGIERDFSVGVGGGDGGEDGKEDVKTSGPT